MVKLVKVEVVSWKT